MIHAAKICSFGFSFLNKHYPIISIKFQHKTWEKKKVLFIAPSLFQVFFLDFKICIANWAEHGDVATPSLHRNLWYVTPELIN